MNFISSDPGNDAEVRAKRWGFGFYASHLGRLAPDGYYMKRWILRLPFGFTVRLHKIIRSDADRHLHDHPFDFVSLLLTGGYHETTLLQPVVAARMLRRLLTDTHELGQTLKLKTTRYRRRFSIVRRRAEDLHALTLERPIFTLVLAGPKRREWGFATERGWTHNEQYSQRWPERSNTTRSVSR